MPRRSRITVAEVPVHIIQRGNNRGACFFADADYELYLAHLQAVAAKFECAVHAYNLLGGSGPAASLASGAKK
jgi:putative transposase